MKTNRLTLIRGWAAALLLAVALLLPQAAAAYDFMVDGLCYNRNSDGTSVTVTYQKSSSPRYTDLSGDLVIPESVTYSGTTYSVTSIGVNAFEYCSGLTSVTIPNSVTFICEGAFYKCSGLTSVTIPNSVTSIGQYAFAYCTGLTSVTIPNSVTAIRYSAFQGCSGLTSVTIPNSVTSIGDCAFSGCSGLTSVTIPNSVTSIGGYAFLGCKGLTSVTIPNSVTSIGKDAFEYCSGLENMVVEAGNTKYDSRDNCNAIIETATNTLIAGCKTTTIPNSVTSIGQYAFAYCTGLTSVTIPNSVTAIRSSAFQGCSGLTSVTIGNSVTTIGYSAFQGCSGLTSVTIGNSVTSIGSYAFYKCSGLTSVTIGNSVTSIGSYAFQGCSGLTSVTIGNSVTSIGSSAFLECSGLTSVTIPNSVTSIGNYAFEYCSGLTDIYSCIENPTNVTLGGDAFYEVPTNACVLHVPAGKVAAYRAASQWSDFTNIVEMEPPTVLVTSLMLNETVAELTAGETLQLTATVLPENATDRTVTWTSSDPAVATVDATGLVTAVAAGTATITATTNDGSNLAASCEITVNPAAILATSVSLDQSNVSLSEGMTLQLTATVLPDDATDKSVTWASSNEAVATVDENGLVTAVAAGTATITATTSDGSNFAASCEITVEATAANRLMVENCTVLRGHSLTLPVQLINTANNLTALQADIHLPQGVTIEMDGDDYVIDLVSQRVGSDHTLSSNRLASGAVRVLIASPTKKLFTGNDGDLFTISLLTSDEMSAGDYAVTIDNIILSDNQATTYLTPDVTSTITVKDVEMGDATGDGQINVGDYVATAGYILEEDPQPFVFVAADIDANGTIDVGDLVGVAGIILSTESPAGMPAHQAAASGTANLGVKCNSTGDGHYLVTIDMSNDASVTAMQMDLTLPDGLRLAEASLTDRASGSHAVDFNRLHNGDWRVLAASGSNKAFRDTEGAVLTLELEGDEEGHCSIENIMLAQPNGARIVHDNLNFEVGLVTGVNDMYSKVNIYAQGDMLIVDSPHDAVAQLVMPNGMSRCLRVSAGRNVYRLGNVGYVFVKVDNQVAKFRF